MLTFDETRKLMAGYDLPSLAEMLNRPAWFAHAACIGQTDAFYPTRGEDVRPAKALCESCPVRDRCRALADTASAGFGIWGGTSERERRSLRRRAA